MTCRLAGEGMSSPRDYGGLELQPLEWRPSGVQRPEHSLGTEFRLNPRACPQLSVAKGKKRTTIPRTPSMIAAKIAELLGLLRTFARRELPVASGVNLDADRSVEVLDTARDVAPQAGFEPATRRLTAKHGGSSTSPKPETW